MRIEYTLKSKVHIIDSCLNENEEAYLDESVLEALKEKNIVDEVSLEKRDFQLFREPKAWQIAQKTPVTNVDGKTSASFLPPIDLSGFVTIENINGKNIYLCHF